MPVPGPIHSWTLGSGSYITETGAKKAKDHANSIRASNPTSAAKWDWIAAQPAPLWCSEDYGNAHGASGIDAHLDAAAAAGTKSLFVLYDIMGRDGGSFSSGGATDLADYQAFVTSCANAVAGRPCIWIIEPDGIPLMSEMSGGINGAAAEERKTAILFAVTTLRAQGPNVRIYIDAGSNNFRPASEMATILGDCGIDIADGISLNVAHSELIEDEYDFFLAVKALNSDVGGVVIDTGRCGRGPYPFQSGDRFNVKYINPPPYGFLDGTGGKPNRPTLGVAIGPPPTSKMDVSGYPGLHALLWVKFPVSSDGAAPTSPSGASNQRHPEHPAVTAPDAGDTYASYWELCYDAAYTGGQALDFSQWAPFPWSTVGARAAAFIRRRRR